MHEEEQLLRAMTAGDPEAAQILVTRYYPEILRYCLWHAPNRSLGEDAAQETFLKAIRCSRTYVHRGTFRAYLYKIAANTCIDMGRRSWTSEEPLEEAEQEAGESSLEAVEADIALRQRIRTLPKEQQEVVLLRFSQDLTLREIGAVMGLPLRTVQSRLRAALKQLKKEMERGETL